MKRWRRGAVVLVIGAVGASGCLGILGGDVDFTGKGSGGGSSSSATGSTSTASATGSTGGATTSGSSSSGSSSSGSSSSGTTTSSSGGMDAGPTVWAKRYPSMGGSMASGLGRAVRVDSTGNVAFAGVFSGSVDFGCGPLLSAGTQDLFVVKLDSSGKCVWSKRFGDVNGQRVDSLAVDSGGNIVAAGFFQGTIDFGAGPLISMTTGNPTAFVVKLSPTGSAVWSKQFGDGTSAGVDSVAVDSSGDVAVTGVYQGTINFGQGNFSNGGAFVAKLSSGSGAGLWSLNKAGGSAITVDIGNNIIVAGQGAATLPGCAATNKAFYLAKLDTNGACSWANGYGNGAPIDQRVDDIAVDASGEVVLSGPIQSGTIAFGTMSLTVPGLFLAKLDAFGSPMWAKDFPTSAMVSLTTVAIQADKSIGLVVYSALDNLDLGGGSLGAVTSGICMGHYDTAGVHLWSKQFPSAPPLGSNVAYSVAPDTVSPAFVLTGGMTAAVDFGTGPLVNAGNAADAFVAKVVP